MRLRDLLARNLLAAVTAAALWALAAQPAGAVSGMVLNGTTGEPQGGVSLTLSSFEGGMTPLEEAVSQADGTFAFAKQLPAVSSGQPFAGAIRAEHGGIGYTEVLRDGTAHDSVRITVYSVSATEIPSPTNRFVFVEPRGSELAVVELYQFANASEPPVTYSSEDGSLQFYLPPAAQGAVDVSGTGPAGMPLPSTALPVAGVPDLYQVDFPLKPGENRLDLQYALPYEDPAQLIVRSAYPTVPTRVVAPPGVQVEGIGLTDLGQEPRTQASLYSIPEGSAVTLQVSGSSQLRSEAPVGGGDPAPISVEPAPVAKELVWIAGLAIAILGLGFFHLLSSRLPDGHGERG